MTYRSGNAFSAVDATLGYLYQVRCALLWTLRRLKVEPDFLVGIETLAGIPRSFCRQSTTTAALGLSPTQVKTCGRRCGSGSKVWLRVRFPQRHGSASSQQGQRQPTVPRRTCVPTRVM